MKKWKLSFKSTVKVRAKLNIPKDLSKEEMQDLALVNDNVKASIEGKEIKK